MAVTEKEVRKCICVVPKKGDEGTTGRAGSEKCPDLVLSQDKEKY